MAELVHRPHGSQDVPLVGVVEEIHQVQWGVPAPGQLSRDQCGWPGMGDADPGDDPGHKPEQQEPEQGPVREPGSDAGVEPCQEPDHGTDREPDNESHHEPDHHRMPSVIMP